jgi:hypothetical protein
MKEPKLPNKERLIYTQTIEINTSLEAHKEALL